MAPNTTGGIYNKVCCNRHPRAHLIEDTRAGDMICSECGLVVGDRVIDISSEWRTFTNTETARPDRNRCGGRENPLLNGSNLTTFIGGTGAAKYFNQPKKNNSNRTLLAAYDEISSMAGRINLPQCIIDRANNLFKQLHDKQCLMGRSTDCKAAACLYISCRQEDVPRTFKEICAVSKVSLKDISRCYKMILRVLHPKMNVIKTGDFMARFCSRIFLPHQVQRAATRIASKTVDMYLAPGRSPISVTAAAIFMASQASDEKRTRKEVGDIAGISETTIRRLYKLMLPHARTLFPDNFNFKTPIESLPSP